MSGQAPAEGDAVAWMWQHDETGRTGFVDCWQVENGWQEQNPRLRLVQKLYVQPQPKGKEELAASQMPLVLKLRVLADQIKRNNGLRDNAAKDHRTLIEAADALAATQAPAPAPEPVARVTEFVGAVRIEAECLPHTGALMKIGDMLYAGPVQAPAVAHADAFDAIWREAHYGGDPENGFRRMPPTLRAAIEASHAVFHPPVQNKERGNG